MCIFMNSEYNGITCDILISIREIFGKTSEIQNLNNIFQEQVKIIYEKNPKANN